jgi:toxin FitB
LTRYLLDTNFISELDRARPNQKAIDFFTGQQLDHLYLCDVTIAEIRYGIELLPDGSKRSKLELWIDQKLRPMFDGRVLPLTEDVLLKWRVIIAEARQRCYTYSHPDVLIAATAAYHGLTVVTRNTREFREAGVAVLDPWTGKLIKAR